MKRILACFLLCTKSLLAEPVVPACAFIDSIGINVHLHYTDTAYYQQYPLVQQALVDLGIHHVRDAVIANPIPQYLQRYHTLAGLGIHALYSTQPTQSAVVLSTFTNAAGPALEGLEAPNEWDISKDPNWAATLRTYLPALFAFSSSRGLPDVGPSLVNQASYPALGNVSQWQNFANLHNYPGGRYPGTQGWGSNGYGGLQWQLRNLQYTSPGSPIYSTETGYTNDPSIADFVPQSVAAKYFPRLLLLQYMEGIRRTYLYELLSSGGEDFGLLTSAGVRKPTFTAVAALTSLLQDTSHPAGPDVPLAITGTDANVRHLLLGRADGTLYLALWVESSGFDNIAHTLTSVPTQAAHITLPFTPARINAHHWKPEGTVNTVSISPASAVDVLVGDLLTILELTPPSANAHRAQSARRSTRSS